MKKSSHLLLFAVSLSILLTGCADEVQRLNERALRSLKRGNTDEAVALLEQARRKEPRNPIVLGNLAEAYLKQEQIEKALDTISEAIDNDRGNPKLIAARAKIQMMAGQTEEALEYLEGIPQSIRNDPAVSFYYGLALMETGRVEDALPILESFVDKKSRNAQGQVALGVCLLKAGRRGEARSALEQALAINPDLPEAHIHMAQYYLSAGREYGQAKEHLYTARRLDPSNDQVYYLLGQANLALNALSEAARTFEEALKIAPQSWAAYLGLAEIEFQRDNFDQAQDYTAKAQEIAPNQPRVHNFLGRLAQKRNQKALAIRHYMESLRLDPDQPDIEQALEELQSSG